MDDHLWAESFTGEQKDIFELESKIAKKVASKVKIVLSPQEIEQIDRVYTENTEAHNLYLKGRFFWHRRGEDNLRLSMDYFNQALEQDSNYSLAYAGLADAYHLLPFYSNYSMKDAYTIGKKYVIKALDLDSTLAEPHVTLGSMEMYFKHNWKSAEREFLKAIELNPNYADTYQFYAEYLQKVDKLDEALININKAIELDPNAFIKYGMRANIYDTRGNINEALKDVEKLLEINKNYLWAYWRNFNLYVELGEDKKALDELNKYFALEEPEENFKDQLNEVYAESGINGIYHWYINRLYSREWIDHSFIAEIYGKMGDREQTLDNLEKAFEQYEKGQFIILAGLKVDRNFKFLHGDPRFNALLRKVNLSVD
jgi:tetratricopeptide (TPR) repeat protein